MSMSIFALLSEATATGAGVATGFLDSDRGRVNRVFQAKGATTAGAGAAAVTFQGSLDRTNWVAIGSVSLTLGTSETSDGFASDAAWPFVRAVVDSISGTGATVTALMGA